MIKQHTRTASFRRAWSLRLGGLLVVVSGMLVASVVATTRDADTTIAAGAGGGLGTLPPNQLVTPIALILVGPAQQHILAMVTIARPEDTVVLRSPHDHGRIVQPVRRTADGLFVFTVPEDTDWLLTVVGSGVVDVPVAAGQDIWIVLP